MLKKTLLVLSRAVSLACVLLLTPVAAVAAPMAYFTGGAMVMTELSEDERDFSVNYSFTPRDALGFRAGWMRSTRFGDAPDAHAGGAHGSARSPTEHKAAELTYTRLVQRWNTPSGQANIWFFAGLGAIRSTDFAGERFFASPGVQFDIETTRLYFSAKAQLHRAKNVRTDLGVVRAGFAFWEPEYEETQPWLVVEAKRSREFSEKIEITPMLRLINRNFFAEAGVTLDGKFKLGLMLVYSN